MPFRPFAIFTADGRSYRIETNDHLAVGQGVVVVMGDDDLVTTLSGLLIAGVEVQAAAEV